MFTNAIQAVMLGSFLTILIFYLAYSLVLHRFNSNSGIYNSSMEFHFPNVSMIIPVYNEEKIIVNKIENIEQLNYPEDKIEILFVDGSSTDTTTETIQNSIKNCKKRIKLIRQVQRGGYNTGISRGILSSTGEIIAVTDAGAYHDPEALKHLVKHFNNVEVGAVTGREVILRNGKGLGSELEAVYRNYYDNMRLAETTMDSTPDTKGEILAMRRDICMSLLAKIENSPNASFDCCIPYQAKMGGYRTVYEPRAKYYEYAPATFMDRMSQQIRRASILIGSMLLFKNMLLKKRYDKFGLVIMPAHFIMLMVLPWLFLLGVTSLFLLAVINPLWLILWSLFLVPLLISRTRLFVISFIQSQAALLMGALRVATRKRSLYIDTIPSTRV